jgi:hypothetical protein
MKAKSWRQFSHILFVFTLVLMCMLLYLITYTCTSSLQNPAAFCLRVKLTGLQTSAPGRRDPIATECPIFFKRYMRWKWIIWKEFAVGKTKKLSPLSTGHPVTCSPYWLCFIKVPEYWVKHEHSGHHKARNKYQLQNIKPTVSTKPRAVQKMHQESHQYSHTSLATYLHKTKNSWRRNPLLTLLFASDSWCDALLGMRLHPNPKPNYNPNPNSFMNK